MSKPFVLSLFVALAISRCAAQTTIPVRSAAKHIGETVTVCEKVFSGQLLRTSNITLLDLGGYHPNQPLIVVIQGRDRSKFKGNPELDYDGKDIMVTGKVILYKGKPGIVVQNPGRLKLVMIDNDRILQPIAVKKE